MWKSRLKLLSHLKRYFRLTSFLSSSLLASAFADSSQGPSKNSSLAPNSLSISDKSSRRCWLDFSTFSTLFIRKSSITWEYSWLANLDNTCLVRSTTSYLHIRYTCSVPFMSVKRKAVGEWNSKINKNEDCRILPRHLKSCPCRGLVTVKKHSSSSLIRIA